MSERRRRLLFRSWHRGIREMDLIMGRFADACIAEHDATPNSTNIERLLEVPDHDLYAWITGEGVAPAPYATALAAAAARLSPDRAAMPLMARSPADLLQRRQAADARNVADGAEGLVLADLARAVAAKPDAPAISLVVVCRDGPRMAALARGLSFFAPDIERCWNSRPGIACPTTASRRMPASLAQRMTTLSRLANVKGRDRPSILLTTVNAVLQRVPPRDDGCRAGAVGRARQCARHGRVS